MICKVADIDAYLLYYLDFESIMHLTCVSKDQYAFITNLSFIQELKLLKEKHIINIYNIIEHASYYNYITLINWIDESINEFIYDDDALDRSSYKIMY